MLKKMLGIDPAEIKTQIEGLASAAIGMHTEQKRQADFLDLLAQNAIKANEKLATVLHELASVTEFLQVTYNSLDRSSRRQENELGAIRDDIAALQNAFIEDGLLNPPSPAVLAGDGVSGDD